ncbi:hypothetical protein CCACVL1_30055, partial [Corchorus capsularis]
MNTVNLPPLPLAAVEDCRCCFQSSPTNSDGLIVLYSRFDYVIHFACPSDKKWKMLDYKNILEEYLEESGELK